MDNRSIFITGTGLYHPPESISNKELVATFNQYVALFNEKNKMAIAEGQLPAMSPSSEEFIYKASGIKQRYVINKEGILNPQVMKPLLPERSDDQLSYQCEMGLRAALAALEEAKLLPSEVQGLIVACSNFERPYPAISIELQSALKMSGFAFDMNVACSSATFGLKVARDMIASGSAQTVLVVNPEICTGHLNFCDREGHFIFGDAATATVVQEGVEKNISPSAWKILSTRLQTQFSSNIRNNGGFLQRSHHLAAPYPEKLFVQQGRRVFKEVVPLVSGLITEHLRSQGLTPQDIACFWLHQANINMNNFIYEKLRGTGPTSEECPSFLEEFGNTSSAGSMIAFHRTKNNYKSGNLGVICSFGAGLSVGNIILQKN